VLTSLVDKPSFFSFLIEDIFDVSVRYLKNFVGIFRTDNEFIEDTLQRIAERNQQRRLMVKSAMRPKTEEEELWDHLNEIDRYQLLKKEMENARVFPTTFLQFKNHPT
jgi:hypothetical protein